MFFFPFFIYLFLFQPACVYLATSTKAFIHTRQLCLLKDGHRNDRQQKKAVALTKADEGAQSKKPGCMQREIQGEVLLRREGNK